MRFSILPILFFISSCAYMKIINTDNREVEKLSGDLKYEFNDTTGAFIKLRQKGMDSNQNKVVKSIIYTENKKDTPVEKLVSISKQNDEVSGIKLLTPLRSEVVYWFDGNRYKSSIRLDSEKKTYIINSFGKEKEWNRTKKLEIESSKKAYCFFSQLVECIEYSGFFEKSRRSKSGSMNLEIIWDGYPFFNEQYLNDKDNVSARGKISYAGKETIGLHKYSLKVDGQVINYSIYRDKYLAKMFWVSQGISQILME